MLAGQNTLRPQTRFGLKQGGARTLRSRMTYNDVQGRLSLAPDTRNHLDTFFPVMFCLLISFHCLVTDLSTSFNNYALLVDSGHGCKPSIYIPDTELKWTKPKFREWWMIHPIFIILYSQYIIDSIYMYLLHIWVCLKIGYIPNYSHLIGIMIINHWV